MGFYSCLLCVYVYEGNLRVLDEMSHIHIHFGNKDERTIILVLLIVSLWEELRLGGPLPVT